MLSILLHYVQEESEYFGIGRTSFSYKQQPSPGRTTIKFALLYVGHSWEGGKEIGPKEITQRDEDYVTR